ncbi:MAG: hypothetical protein IJZ72_03005 [Oscillospiraceae bacterium]|nr:hypothetical protein [Oscillospiraceae bacterium]
MKNKILLFLLLICGILTACNDIEPDIQSFDSEAVTETVTEKVSEEIKAEASVINVFVNGLEASPNDIKNHPILKRIHVDHVLRKKYAEYYENNESLDFIYNELTADFDVDGENETVMVQKCSADDKGYVWYYDDLCTELCSCGTDDDDVFVYYSDDTPLLGVMSEKSDGDITKVRVFAADDMGMDEYLCRYGELCMNGSELSVIYNGEPVRTEWNSNYCRFEIKEPVKAAEVAETDEFLIKGQAFAEAYAEMSLNYLHGGAWDNYTEIRYFDFGNKSEGNYFEHEGIPFYKLLISKYTYDEMMEHIRSFYADDEAYEENAWAEGSLFVGKDNSIYVNGNEPTFIYGLRNKKAEIVGYTANDDGTVIYDCYAESAQEGEADLYFSFVLDSEGRLTEKVNDSAMQLFLPESESSETAPKYAETYADILYNRLTQEGGCTFANPYAPDKIFELKPASIYEREAIALESDLIVWDVNNDGTPELLIGNHTTTGGMTLNIISADGTDMGAFICNTSFDFREIDGELYTFSGMNSMPVWTKFSNGNMSLVVFKMTDSKNKLYYAYLYNGSTLLLQYNDITEEEFKKLITSHIGAEYDEFLNAPSAQLAYVHRRLEVPDPENYTKEDIYNCLEGVFAEYEKNSSILAQSDNQLPKEIQAYLDVDWREKYRELINIYQKDRAAGTAWGMPMYFSDIDSDSVYELAVKIGSYSNGCDMLFLFDYDNSEIRYKGAINGGCVKINEEYIDLSGWENEVFSIGRDNQSILTSVDYASGGVYGYTFYLSKPDESGVYHSQAIASVYSETDNYSPPYNWIYTSGGIEAEETDESEFTALMNNYSDSADVPIIEATLYASLFVSEDAVSDHEYEEMISQLEKDIKEKYPIVK